MAQSKAQKNPYEAIGTGIVYENLNLPREIMVMHTHILAINQLIMLVLLFIFCLLD